MVLVKNHPAPFKTKGVIHAAQTSPRYGDGWSGNVTDDMLNALKGRAKK